MGIVEAVLADVKQQGVEEGIEKGIDKKNKQATINMLKKGFEVKTIAEILEISVKYILAVKKQMNRKK